MNRLFILLKDNLRYFKNDTLSGMTVALALIPEAIAFAFVAGVTPLLSLQTAVVVVLVASVFTGRPGMISASTAAIAIVLAPLVAEYGLEYLFATVVLMGIIQVVLGITKLGKFTSIIPHSVVLGFLNGLAIVIFLAQWHQFQVDTTVVVNGIETIVTAWLPMIDMGIMLGFVFLTMAIIYYFPKFTKAVPSSLVAIGVVTVVSIFLVKFDIYHLITVEHFAKGKLVGALPGFHIPSLTVSLEMLRVIFPYAFIASLVGLAEAALTLRVIDDMTETKGNVNREFFAQGIANFVNGFTGGMGGAAMIGQSIVNIESGGRTRWSGVVAGISLLLFILFAGPLINAIPLASLIGLMFMVVVSTFKWESLKYGHGIPKQDYVVIAIVSLVTVFADLATAVIVGVLLSTVMFAWEKGKRMEVHTSIDKKGTKVYDVFGIVFFGSTVNFKDVFDVKSDPDTIVLDLTHARIMDFSALEAIDSVTKKYALAGKKFTVTNPGKGCKVLLDNAKNITSISIK